MNKTVYTRFQISECKKQVFRSMFTKIYYLLLTTLEIMTTYSVHTASAREEKGSVSRGAHILKSKVLRHNSKRFSLNLKKKISICNFDILSVYIGHLMAV